MARSGVASAPPQKGTILRRPKRPRKVQGCLSARLFGANLPDPFGLTRTPHGGPLGCPATTAPGTGNCLSPVSVATTLRALALQQGHCITSNLAADGGLGGHVPTGPGCISLAGRPGARRAYSSPVTNRPQDGLSPGSASHLLHSGFLRTSPRGLALAFGSWLSLLMMSPSRYSHRGLSPHKFAPMLGAHPPINRNCNSPLRRLPQSGYWQR